MLKYSKLTNWLKKYEFNHVTLMFVDIESIIGKVLPKSAHEYFRWWDNGRNGSQSLAWNNAGYSVTAVDMENQRVTFIRIRKD
jgi:hypothetical protein